MDMSKTKENAKDYQTFPIRNLDFWINWLTNFDFSEADDVKFYFTIEGWMTDFFPATMFVELSPDQIAGKKQDLEECIWRRIWEQLNNWQNRFRAGPGAEKIKKLVLRAAIDEKWWYIPIDSVRMELGMFKHDKQGRSEHYSNTIIPLSATCARIQREFLMDTGGANESKLTFSHKVWDWTEAIQNAKQLDEMLNQELNKMAVFW